MTNNDQQTPGGTEQHAARRAASPTRTIALLALPVVALYGAMQSMSQVLVPSLVAQLDPAGKVADIANISLVSGIMGTLFIVIGPAVSDRTRTRFGRRSPYLAALSVAICAILLLIGASTSIIAVIALMGLFGACTNWYSGCLYAVLPDRIPENKRGTASSVLGLGLPLGVLIFVNLASRVAPATAYITVGATMVVATAAFVLGSREPSSTDMPRPEKKERGEFSLSFLEAFRHWNFTMTFLSRLTFYLAFFAVSSYTMYILTDYIGADRLPGGNATVAVATLSTISTVFQIAAVLTCGAIADRFDLTKTIVGIAGFAMIAAYACPLVMPTWGGMIAFNAISGAAGGVYFSVDAALMSRVLPCPGKEGRDMGILNAASSATAMFAALVGSLLIGAFGGYAPLFAMGVVLAALCGACTFAIRGIR
ncbi:MFS transporter [Bifidobacterium stellenboschense]|uniref:Major facilitator transporter n=1 Tax=Bifidobacterium stellenboschense TaxID=762211 RepID=A0A087DFM2_9BIFI|nr:MFS transporter [Bifidobacterium stellenboschense]KFI94322.1 major facilitator transporter [Bifidobacterium stellenboschense]